MTKKDEEKNDEGLDLVEVHRVWGPAEAEVIKSLLESHGIPCLFRGMILQTVLPFTADGLGEIKILVPERDLEQAKKILTENSQA